MTLTHLSLQRVTGTRRPLVLDNDTRARMLRAALPSPKYNTHDWPYGRRYEADALADGPPEPIHFESRRGE